MLSRLKDRYSLSFRNKPAINAQTLQASAIPTSQRHAMAEEIESTMHKYPYSQLDLLDRDSDCDSPQSSSSHSLSKSSKSPPTSPAHSPAAPEGESPSSTPSFAPQSSPYSSPYSPTRSRRALSKSNSKNQKLLQDLEATIHQTKQALSKMKDSETFLDLRIRKYRSLLDQQSVRLCSRHLHEGNDHIIVEDTVISTGSHDHGDGDGDGDAHHAQSNQSNQPIQSTNNHEDITDDNIPRISIDVEKQLKIQHQFRQQEINEQKLNSILKLQHSIITEIEIMRRSLVDLEHKKQEIINKQQECQQFLIASAEVDLHIMQMQQQMQQQTQSQPQIMPQDEFEHDEHCQHSTTIPMMEMRKLNLNANLDYDHEQSSAKSTSSSQVDALV